MGHGITARDRFGYVGAKGWHGLGSELRPGLTAHEAAEELEIKFKMRLVEITAEMDGKVIDLSAFRAHVREDTGEAFEVVSKDYQSFQVEDLCELADAIREADPEAWIETGGTLLGGRRVFFLMKLGTFKAGNGDEVHSYLCCTTSNDRTGSTHAFYTTVRVVCLNTLSFAMGRDAKIGFKSSHRGGSTEARLREAKKVLGIAAEVERQAAATAQALFRKPMVQAAVDSYFDSVYERTFGARPGAKRTVLTEEQQVAVGGSILEDLLDAKHDNGKVLDEAVERYDKAREKRMGLWVANHESDVARGTAWGALNAITQYHDHQGKNMGDDRRVNSVLFGLADQRKRVALDEILTVANLAPARR